MTLTYQVNVYLAQNFEDVHFGVSDRRTEWKAGDKKTDGQIQLFIS